jgi:hypothetical protein
MLLKSIKKFLFLKMAKNSKKIFCRYSVPVPVPVPRKDRKKRFKWRTKIRFKKVFLEKFKMFGDRAPLQFNKRNMIQIEVYESNFCSPFIKDSITETTKSSQKLLKIFF